MLDLPDFDDPYNPEWQAKYPKLFALYKLICPEKNGAAWKPIYCMKDDGLWICLIRGLWANEQFCCIAGPHRAFLHSLWKDRSQRTYFETADHLSKLVERVDEKHHIDLSSIPLEAWVR